MDKGFLVFGDIEETLDDLTDEQVGRLFRAMVSYHNTGERPEFEDVALHFAFKPIRQQMDRGAEAYKKRCEQNRQNSLKRVERERLVAMAAIGSDGSLTKTKTETDSDSKAEADTESAGADVWSLSRSVLSYLNKEAGTSYRVDDAEYVRLISDLSHKGYTESQMIEVVDKKCADWLGDPKVEQYLRPRTLFGQKFEEYLNAPASAKMKERAEKKKQQDREMAELQRGTEALNRLFEKGQARHEQFMREHGLRSEATNE